MKRSNRLVVITNYLIRNPGKHIQLSYFSEQYQVAKSSISEDLSIINQMFQQEGAGYLQTFSGAAGGVKYIPYYSSEKSQTFVNQLCKQLEDSSRILPGGYLYMSDILGNPNDVKEIGHIFATVFANLNID